MPFYICFQTQNTSELGYACPLKYTLQCSSLCEAGSALEIWDMMVNKSESLPSQHLRRGWR